MGFYTPFLTAIHEKTERKIAILAHGHLGHSPTILQGDKYKDDSNISLTAQVESAIEAAQALHDTYPQARLVITGHSMGCWVALQVTHGTSMIIAQRIQSIPDAKESSGHCFSAVSVDSNDLAHCSNPQWALVRCKLEPTGPGNSSDPSIFSGYSGHHSVTLLRPCQCSPGYSLCLPFVSAWATGPFHNSRS